jgi:hypothetical protein
VCLMTGSLSPFSSTGYCQEMLAFDVGLVSWTKYRVRTTLISPANSYERSMGMKSGAL